jgi:hypothetical protein
VLLLQVSENAKRKQIFASALMQKLILFRPIFCYSKFNEMRFVSNFLSGQPGRIRHFPFPGCMQLSLGAAG